MKTNMSVKTQLIVAAAILAVVAIFFACTKLQHKERIGSCYQ
jgi:hypothetical protein